MIDAMTPSTPFMTAVRPEDAAECLRLRGMTRENAFTEAELLNLRLLPPFGLDPYR